MCITQGPHLRPEVVREVRPCLTCLEGIRHNMYKLGRSHQGKSILFIGYRIFDSNSCETEETPKSFISCKRPDFG